MNGDDSTTFGLPRGLMVSALWAQRRGTNDGARESASFSRRYSPSTGAVNVLCAHQEKIKEDSIEACLVGLVVSTRPA